MKTPGEMFDDLELRQAREDSIRKLAGIVFNTEDGKILLSLLVEHYLLKTPVIINNDIGLSSFREGQNDIIKRFYHCVYK